MSANEKNESTFLKTLRSAMSGDADDAYKLFCMYDTGDGVEANAGEARKWLAKAAKNGHKEARKVFEERLSKMSAESLFQERLKDANRGDVEAMSYVAGCYMTGFGVEQCRQTGVEWLEKESAARSKQEPTVH